MTEYALNTRFDTFEVSTGSWAPFFLINGPIRNEININCSSGALSPGNLANAAIGRAVGLMVKNIGGARKAVEDMGTLGNPAKYTLVLGENEEESPWQPLSEEARSGIQNAFRASSFFAGSFFPPLIFLNTDRFSPSLIASTRGRECRYGERISYTL